MQQVAREVRTLRDIEEIKQLKACCIRFIDTQDWEAWRDLLTDDFRLDAEGGIHEGRDAIVSMVSSALAGASTVHHVFCPEISVTGPDSATGVWAMEDLIVFPYDGAPIGFRGYGHCHEEYVRTVEGWRLRSTRETRLRIEPMGDGYSTNTADVIARTGSAP